MCTISTTYSYYIVCFLTVKGAPAARSFCAKVRCTALFFNKTNYYIRAQWISPISRRPPSHSDLEHSGHVAAQIVHDIAADVLAGGRRVGHLLEVGPERLRADAVVEQQARVGQHPVLHGAHHRPDPVLDARLEAHHADLAGLVFDAEHLHLG